MSDGAAKLPGDEVEGLDPIGFAVTFTRAMRRQRTAAHTPSLRTSLAIPRLLTARCLRTGALSPRDYVAAAVLCSPPEDQDLAEAVARSIVFPEADADAPKVKVASDAAADAAADEVDPMANILGDLASLDVDLDALDDLSDLDALLAADDEAAPDELGAFDLFESLYSSADPAERALGELVHHFGGPAELEASGLRTVFLVRVWAARQLLGAVGELTPDLVAWGVAAGYGPELRRGCREPWELAGVLAAQGDPDLEPHLDDLLDEGTARELGRVLAFLGPHPAAAPRRSAFAAAALSRALELSDFAELVVGLGEWIDPPDDLIPASIAVNPRRTLEAARWLESSFGVDLRETVFVRWYATQSRADLGQLAVMAVGCDPWEAALEEGLAHEVARLDAVPPPSTPDGPVDRVVDDALTLTEALSGTGLKAATKAARTLSTEVLVKVPTAPQFLPVIDAFLARGVVPRLDPVLARARELGVSEDDVLDRLGQALEQLRQLVLTDSHDADRFQRLVERVRAMPAEMMAQLCAVATANGNLEAMAALLAVDMGEAAGHLPPGQAADAVGYKGIGGGSNLLKQWFTHRHRLATGLKASIREQAKAALLDQALDWMGKGDGSGERGLIPQQQTRPFRAGDDVDGLDLDGTLESIVASGKPLDQVTEEDLFATSTARGRAALTVLIDISGSMSGGELAVCAIAVVMLLGKLLPEEVALAVFESDTHVIKTFDDVADLDEVADQVLDLAATGGTRADAALQWAAGQFEGVPEADVRVLFLLSDFAFFEGEEALRTRCGELAATGARLLAASHGYVHQQVLDLLVDAIGGEHLSMRDLRRLPELLLAALTRLGE